MRQRGRLGNNSGHGDSFVGLTATIPVRGGQGDVNQRRTIYRCSRSAKAHRCRLFGSYAAIACARWHRSRARSHFTRYPPSEPADDLRGCCRPSDLAADPGWAKPILLVATLRRPSPPGRLAGVRSSYATQMAPPLVRQVDCGQHGSATVESRRSPMRAEGLRSTAAPIENRPARLHRSARRFDAA